MSKIFVVMICPDGWREEGVSEFERFAISRGRVEGRKVLIQMSVDI